MYCGKCGRKMNEELVSADKLEKNIMSFFYKPYSKFDTKTGKKQYVKHYQCPKRNCLCSGGHDSYFVDELIIGEKIK